jgi:hypothetical protein
VLFKLINHFAGRERAPVQVLEVLYVLKSWGIKDDVFFYPVDADTAVIKGMITHWEAPWDDGSVKRFADIATARTLTDQERRLIECKELLHILDPDWALVNKNRAIEELIEKIIIPPEFQDPFGDDMAHANSDRVAELHAVAVLFPWATRQLLLLKVSQIGIQKIADDIVDLPPKHVATVMSEKWAEIYRMMTTEILPVRDAKGDVILHDMFVAGEWIGSRRTLEQCKQRLETYSL